MGTVSGHMGDTRFQRHDCPRPLVQDAEPQRPEMKVPTTIIDAVQTDHFSGERLADEHVTPGPLHGAVGADVARLEAIPTPSPMFPVAPVMVVGGAVTSGRSWRGSGVLVR